MIGIAVVTAVPVHALAASRNESMAFCIDRAVMGGLLLGGLVRAHVDVHHRSHASAVNQPA